MSTKYDDDDKEFRDWIKLLNHSEALTRSEAAENPPQCGDVNRVARSLAPLLDDESDLVRMSAAESLGIYPGEAARKALRAYLQREKDPLCRAHAISSLGLVGESDDIDFFLTQLTEQPDPHIAVHSMTGLYELIRRLVIHGLAAYLDHSRPEVRTTAADALGDVVQSRDDHEVLMALQQQLGREPIPGARSDIRSVIEAVWGKEAVDNADEADTA